MVLMKANDCRDCIYKECRYQKEIAESITDFAKEAQADSDVSITISKMQEDKQLVFGWANISKNKDGSFPIDWAGDVIEPEDLEVAAYTHVLKYRDVGERHKGSSKGVLVESMMFTKEKIAALGLPANSLPEGWWVGYYIADKEVFNKCKSGEYKMFSIQGGGERIPIQGGKA